MTRPIFKAWGHPRSAALGIAVILAILLWPALPLHSLNVWLMTLTRTFPMNVLYPVFALAMGSYAALYLYDRTVAKCCRIDAASAAPSLFGIILGACPACIPFVAFFLPLSATIAIGYYSWLILLASILLVTFSLWRAQAFRRMTHI